MSDITHEAPERIWLQLGAGDEGTHTWADHQVGWDDEGGYEPEYIRADLVQAAVAAALREAAQTVKARLMQETDGLGLLVANRTQEAVLALITEDAQAALDRVVQAQQGARPIATAPRDGTHILVAPYGDPTDLQVSWFIDGEDRWANWSWSVEPSHWFPLPVIRKGKE